MIGMLQTLASRGIFSLIGLVVLAYMIWRYGPAISIGASAPLRTAS